jgi:hypothetical protein
MTVLAQAAGPMTLPSEASFLVWILAVFMIVIWLEARSKR